MAHTSQRLDLDNQQLSLNTDNKLTLSKGNTLQLPLVTSIAALQAFSNDIALFDGSTWEKKSGVASSNGGSYPGTIININGSAYWERKTDYVTPEMFGAKGDGITNDTNALQNSLNFIKQGGKLICNKNYVTSSLTINFNSNNTEFIIIEGSGKITFTNLTLDSYGISFIVGSNVLIRNLIIKNIKFYNGYNTILLDGGTNGTNQFLYHITLENIEIAGSLKDGITFKNNFFESQLYNCYVGLPSNNTTGSAYKLDASDELLTGAISSIDLINCQSSSGLHGVSSAGTISDVNIIGGTYLLSFNEGIYLGKGASINKSSIRNVHIESAWTQHVDYSNNGAAVKVIGSFITIEDIYCISNSVQGSYTKYGVETYMTNAASISSVFILGGTGQKGVKINSSSSVIFTIVKGCDYDAVGATKVLSLENIPTIFAPTITPIFNTNITTPLIIGGSTTTSSLNFKTTSGVGTTGANFNFLVGNNGATTAFTILNNTFAGFGNNTPARLLDIVGDNTDPTLRIKSGNFSGNPLLEIDRNAVGNNAMISLKTASATTWNFGIPAATLGISSSNFIIANSGGTQRFVIDSTTGGIGIGATSPLASAKLEVLSTTQGVLLPRMTTVQKNAISSPATGLIVYDTDMNALNIYRGTIWSQIAVSMSIVSKTANYTVTTDDYTIDCTSGTFTVTLPTAASIAGRVYVIKNSGSGTITIACNGAETIDGSTTKVLSVQYNSFTLQSNGTNWILI